MNKNLIDRPYGRFHYIPKILAEKGHNVTILYLNYKNEPPDYDYVNNMHCHTISIFRSFGLGYFLKACQITKTVNPDWVIGFSDTYFGILANYIAHKYNTHSLIDAYDNFESYIPWLKPIHFLWRQALSSAEVVTAAGPELAENMSQYRSNRPTHVVPMAADPHFPTKLTKGQCRSKLNLSKNKILIGYCGSIYKNRGIEHFFKATQILNKEDNDFQFIISGQLDPQVEIPTHINWLGYIQDEDLPLLIKSMDLLVVVNQDSLFGNFSYPVKLYEAISTNIPVIATSTPPIKGILADHPELLIPHNNPKEIAEKIKEILKISSIKYSNLSSWEPITDNFESILKNHK